MTTSNLEYFIGKVCTIFTNPINRDFKAENPNSYPQPLFQYFMGFIETVDQFGVMLKQINNDQRSFFYHSAIVGICEEEVLDPNNTKDAEMITKLKQKHAEEVKKFEEMTKTAQQMSGPVNADELARKAQDMKDSFGNK